ncbi:hypothetical protein JSQ81_12435 [Sporosarcina sp. Marseille-Q4063]|nr:hypothetical protein JSQ81_12435 [Sporosarcina sp. Marseille-Q4063]
MLNTPDLFGRNYLSKAEVDFKSMNRLLWEEHVNWTRMTIISIVFNLPDLQYVQERLLRNATDMGNCLRPFYGNQIADRYAELLKEHLVLAAELVTAAAKGDAKVASEKEKEWYRNADDIAQFLSSINPCFDKEDIRTMLYEHLALTKFEAVSMIEKNYKEDVAVFDKIEAQALEMADVISDGIIQQFPRMFGLYYTC